MLRRLLFALAVGQAFQPDGSADQVRGTSVRLESLTYIPAPSPQFHRRATSSSCAGSVIQSAGAPRARSRVPVDESAGSVRGDAECAQPRAVYGASPKDSTMPHALASEGHWQRDLPDHRDYSPASNPIRRGLGRLRPIAN